MHSKQKGNIAFSSVVLALQKEGFNVFSEIGDYSRVDLIAEKEGVVRTIQVKYDGTDENFVKLKLIKSGPNGYRYTYSENDVDWFAIYSPFCEKIAWVKSNEACLNGTQFSIRFNKAKNNQKTNVKLIEDYDINGLLRDFTQDAVPQTNGEDKVQTTTAQAGSGN